VRMARTPAGRFERFLLSRWWALQCPGVRAHLAESRDPIRASWREMSLAFKRSRGSGTTLKYRYMGLWGRETSPNRGNHTAVVSNIPVLPEIKRLPGAEAQLCGDYGEGQRVLCQDGSDV
jgi:hypothetical protein